MVESTTLLRHINLWKSKETDPMPDNKVISVYLGETSIDDEKGSNFILETTKDSLGAFEPLVKRWILQETLNELLRD